MSDCYDDRCDYRDPTSSVVVELPNGKTFEVDDATVDAFEHDELTVSALDPVLDEANGPIKVFPAGTWLKATVHDEQHNVLAHFISDECERQAVAWLEQRQQGRRSA